MKQFSRILEYACLIIVISITGLALFTNRFGWSLYLEIFSHFQVQYLIATLILTSVTLCLRHFRILLVTLFCSATLSAQVLPWYVPSHIGTQANYRVLVANLNFSNRDATKTLALMDAEQPDLALFMEVSKAMETQLEPLEETLPYSTNVASDSGILLYSKYPLTDIHLQQFGLNAKRSLATHLNINGQTFSLVATHPLPPMEPDMFRSRNTVLADAGDYIKTQTEPVIFLGDLNTTMWSPYYQALIHHTGLKNTRQGFGIRPTWPRAVSYYRLPAWARWIETPLQIPIDHCLVSPEINVADIHTGTETGSDHAPIVVDLMLPSSKKG